jgi:hypothetical protein
MRGSTVQFISRMKLQELNRQRIKLREVYRQLAEAASAGRKADRLRTLYEGLRELKFAGQPLHSDVVNLEILLDNAEAGSVSPDMLDLWDRSLRDELEAGQWRSEFVYLFGALLEEWARHRQTSAGLREESELARKSLLEGARSSGERTQHAAILQPLLASMGDSLPELAERLIKAYREDFHRPLGKSELAPVLEELGADIYQAPPLRREARRFAGNAGLHKELADALTILIGELATWDWPAEGFPVRALWTRNKWRLYLEEDLPTASLLAVLGTRWADLLSRLIGDRSAVDNRQARLKKLIDLNAPEVILQNEKRMLRLAEQMVGLSSEEGDVWDEGGSVGPPESGSIKQQRAAKQGLLRDLHFSNDYDGEYGGAINRAVQLVHAEIQLALAAFPKRSLYVVKVDLQDYYASLPHDVILAVLRGLGLVDSDAEFFRRFLSPTISLDGRTERQRRGVPMGHTLAGTLAELPLRLLERYVHQHARVRIIRLVDDICVLTPDGSAAAESWKRIEEFCVACGLAINNNKAGAVCIGGPSAEGLPAGRPRWGMLELDEKGDWAVHAPTFAAHLEQSRQRLTAAGSLLSQVQVYNANVKHLVSSLALGVALGDAHRASVGQAIREYHDAFFGPGHGIVAGLATAIRERFLGDTGPTRDIPEGWIYWPITAGGLGLRNPEIVAAQYAEGYRGRQPVAPPSARAVGWDILKNDWADYYAYLLEPVGDLQPADTKVMKTLVADFIARGSELSAGKQKGLSSYWRWILVTYGPQILQRFGTFRFLITELVPLQLISHQLVQDSSLEGSQQEEDVAF